MKNKAIEAMFRIQFNKKDEDQVDVEFISYDGTHYEFNVTDYPDDTPRKIKIYTKGQKKND